MTRLAGERHGLARVLGALTMLGMAGCSSGSSGSESSNRPPAPAPAPVVEIKMVDHRFEFNPDVPSGRVVFRMVNAGQAPHQVVLFPYPEDLPPIDVQLRGTQRRPVPLFAGIYSRHPGETGTFAVDLGPGGRYAMVCPIRDPDGQFHYFKGMAAEFRARPAPGPG